MLATSVGLVLIDGYNLFLRNAMANPHMDSNGERIGGTIGVLRSARKIITDFRPLNVLVVWDGEGGSQRRKAIFKEYKEGRTVRMNQTYEFGETPEKSLENLRRQRTLAGDYLTLLGVPQVRADGVEADDLIAHLAAEYDHGGCVIVTTDQDMLQLVRSGSPGLPWVSVWSPVKKVLYDLERFKAEYLVSPGNFRLVKALTGDKSDNIPGIKGFGPKTVASSFPFLTGSTRWAPAEVLSAAEQLNGTLGKRLIDEKSRFLENLTLVDLSSPMLSATAARQARNALLRDLGCRELELRMRMVRDGTTVTDDHLVQPFREFVLRRRKHLGDSLIRQEESE